jgi:hypothetical protein
MKKISITCLLIIFTFVAFAQDGEFKKFRVGIGLGYAKGSGKGASGGVLLTLEPGYRVTDQILVNLRMESAVILRGTATASNVSTDAAAMGSYTFNGQYYFNTNTFRPFAGVGAGMFTVAAVQVSIDNGTGGAAAATKLGFYPRIGFDAGHFTVSIDYNLIPPIKAGDVEFKNSYLGFRIGGYFGGGRKK